MSVFRFGRRQMARPAETRPYIQQDDLVFCWREARARLFTQPSSRLQITLRYRDFNDRVDDEMWWEVRGVIVIRRDGDN